MPYCRKCGAEVADDNKFWPSCGTAITTVVRGKGEKSEKSEKAEKEEKHEKESEEKAEKAEKHEKGEDRSSTLVGGLILVLLGTIFILHDADMLREGRLFAHFLFGIGAILLLQAAWRYSSGLRGTAMGSLIGGLVLCLLGVGGIMGFENMFAFVLVAIGIGVIALGISMARRNPRPP